MIRFVGKERKTARAAVEKAESIGCLAIQVGGRFFVVTGFTLDRIEREGVQPSRWCREATGRIVCVPGRDG